MARILSELLGASEPLFSVSIQQLERVSGQPGIDARLIAEITSSVHMKKRELGLDPKDTTGKELYHALVALAEKHDGFLARRIGGADPTDVQEMLPLIKQAVDSINVPKNTWAIKPIVAKRLLKAMPPKRVMKHLGYRSVDSMLKRESVYELFGATRLLESNEWQKGFIGKYKTLVHSDFETRNIKVILLDAKKWGPLSNGQTRQKGSNLTHLKEMGVVMLMSMPVKHIRGITIALLPLILHYINEIRLYSAFFKLQQMRPELGQIIAATLIDDNPHYSVVAGHKLHWRVIQRHFGKRENILDYPELFEPHIQPDDLSWRKVEEVLFRLEPALHFWKDLDFVGSLQKDDLPVSLNLMDIAVAYVNGLSYEDRPVYHLRNALQNEILQRYLSENIVEQQVLKQLQAVTLPMDSAVLNLEGIF